MEILTRSTKAVKDKHMDNTPACFFRKKDKCLSISKAAMELFVFKHGDKITFVIDTGRLYFYLSKEDENGFVLTAAPNGGGRIYCALLIRRINETLPSVKRNGPKFSIRASNTRINDRPTFEILIDKNISKNESSH